MNRIRIFIIVLFFGAGVVGTVPLVDITYNEEYQVTVTYDESEPYTEQEQYTEQIPLDIRIAQSETLFDTGSFILDPETRRIFTVYLTEGDWVRIYSQAESRLKVFAVTQEDWIKFSNSVFFNNRDYKYDAWELLIEDPAMDEDIEGGYFAEVGFQCPSTGWYTIYLLNDMWQHHMDASIKVYDFKAIRNWQKPVTIYLPEVKTKTVTKYRTVTKERLETNTRTVTKKGTILELIMQNT
jgi:hypothetical protein